MADVNSVSLTGRLVRDAVGKTISDRNYVSKFSLAVNGKGKDITYYFDCEFFGDRAKKIEQYLTKGKPIGVHGELKQDKWEDNGVKKSKILVRVDDVMFLSLGSKKEGEGENSTRQPSDKEFEDEMREVLSVPNPETFNDPIPF